MNIPLAPGSINPKSMPPGYQLPPTRQPAPRWPTPPPNWANRTCGAGRPERVRLLRVGPSVLGRGRDSDLPITATQVHDGAPVAGLDQVQPGDLLFIPGDGGSAAHPGHVGIAAGDGLVIDAYDTHHGVIVERLDTWAPKIVAIRRVAPATTPPPPAGSALLASGAPGDR